MPDTHAILTDIEGTTSAISFVKETLFPYARQRLPAFVEAHADVPEVQHCLHEAAKLSGLGEASRTEVIDLLLEWIDADRKATPLKALQGMIWKEGYENGDYRAHLYPEVPAKLREWHTDGIGLYVYSSGSVPAQKLFFRYSEAGDLTSLFSGYFDTTTGSKRDPQSYGKIATSIGKPPAQILFLSDTVEELDAAAAAGMHSFRLCRPPLSCPPAGDHHCAGDFNHIAP